jgi:uncharacterized protein
MQQQERDLIADLFGRLQQYENQPRDAEAERLIASYVARQPASPYLLVQTALVQEEALKQARARIAELEGKASGQGSFLGNAPRPGPWGSAAAQAPQPAPAPASPWGQAPQAAGGGGFLRSALATAAGVAGGALLFEGIRNMFGHSTQAFASPLSDVQPLSDNSTLMPPDQLSSADLAQDDGAADDYDLTSDDSSDDSGFDSSSDDI